MRHCPMCDHMFHPAVDGTFRILKETMLIVCPDCAMRVEKWMSKFNVAGGPVNAMESGRMPQRLNLTPKDDKELNE
jgi:hypothetical protein